VKRVSLGLLALFFLMLTSCAQVGTVTNNTFEYPLPQKWVVNISTEFTFFRNIKHVEHIESTPLKHLLRQETDAYFFINAYPQKTGMIAKGIVLGITEVEAMGMYIGYRHDSSKSELEWGKVTLPDDKYEYEFSTKLNALVIPDRFIAALKDAGYKIPPCILTRFYGHLIYGGKSKFIYYWEDAADSGYACTAWEDKWSLDQKQEAYLKEFGKRALQAFRIVNVTTKYDPGQLGGHRQLKLAPQ
jgi:hypothetical protein